MVPVENATGRAALVSKHQTEWTPDENANKVADVKGYTYKEKVLAAKNLESFKGTDYGDERRPYCHYLTRRLVCFEYVILELIPIQKLIDSGSEFFLEKFLRADCNILHGKELRYHIIYPNHPQNVKNGKALKEIPALHNVKLIWGNKI